MISDTNLIISKSDYDYYNNHKVIRSQISDTNKFSSIIDLNVSYSDE